MRRLLLALAAALLASFTSIHAQLTPEQALDLLAHYDSGHLGVAALHVESGECISYNGARPFPMQSVYKFPIAMVMLRAVDAGRYALGDTITVDAAEYIPKRGHSPLRDKYPGGARLTVRELIRYNIFESDGTACDVLLRLLGGPAAVERQIRALGVDDIAIATTEMVQVADDSVSYQNWSTPEAMSYLLAVFHTAGYLSEASHAILLEEMSRPNAWFDKRIKAQLPPGTPLAHKTGTSGTYDKRTTATNDVGLVTLPDGTHLALSVFVADSYATQHQRETLIATAAKVAYDHFAR